MSRIIAVDFDGTICEDKYPEIGRPNTYLIPILQRFQRDGDILILWTCRCGDDLENAVNWCKNHGLEFDYVNENCKENIEKYNNDTRKIYADLYIDDKAIRPEDGVLINE